MRASYLAHGLHVRCSFALPELGPAVSAPPPWAAALPSLTLSLTTPADLTRAWSGASAPPAWRGRLDDCCELAIERGAGGDLLFTYRDRAQLPRRTWARFRLDHAQELLQCAPEDGAIGWQRTLTTNILSTISVMRGYEALHAAAVDSPTGVVAFLAASGEGKSTLAAEFVRRGWPLFDDDVLTLASDASGVRAYPGTRQLCLHEQAAQELELERLGPTLGSDGGERRVAIENASVRPRPVRALFLLERRPGLPLGTESVPANPLVLAPFMLGFHGDSRRVRSRFETYGDLIGSTSLLRLTADRQDPPRGLAEAAERALEYRPALAVGVS